MAVLYRLIAVYLLLVGLAVGAYFVIYPLYVGQGNPDHAGDVWEVLNWFMAVAAILLVLVTFAGTRALAEGADSWDKFVANGRFHIALALLLGFLSNWFADSWGGDSDPVGFLWVVIDIGMAILAVEVALQLWREPDAAWGRSTA